MTAPETTPGADGQTPLPGVHTSTLCTSCGHVSVPNLRCQCGHLDVFHAFNTANTVRKACSITTGPKADRCPCKTYETEGLPS